LAGVGQTPLSGAADWYHACGGGRRTAGDMTTALWRSGDVILGSLAMLFTGIWPQRAFCTGVSRWPTTSPRLTASIRPVSPQSG
jgi:hypothetical protein